MSRSRKTGRDVSGILLLDKPEGWTSNRALQAVKRLYRARKAGHCGSLDPLATGLLPICLGEATKVSAFLLEGDKHYSTTCRLGLKTTTGDADGEVTEERPVGEITAARLEAALGALRGDVDQIPPMHSALKYKGRRLYALAREGVEVERAPRRIHIERLELLHRGEESLELDIFCSKGTYIRTLVEDLGERLGCGAHVTALRRIGVAPLKAPEMVTLEALEARAAQDSEAIDRLLLPVDAALADWPAVELSTSLAFYLGQGRAVRVPGAPTKGVVRLYGPGQRFAGLGEALGDGRVAPRRLISLR